MEDNSGSREDRNCITVALEKVLSLDTIRQLKCAAVQLETFLTQGYDRLIHCTIMLCMMQQGVPFEAPLCMFETLANAEHFVITAHGRSKRAMEAGSITEATKTPCSQLAKVMVLPHRGSLFT